jgi:tRNA-splicing ligase RtcB (3'-phosphate/5'-hydroxy nucleic acid ligase)
MIEPTMRSWLIEPPPREVKDSLDRLRRLDDLVRMAVMPDVHLGERVCIGCVLATRELVYPAAVGADIGCGIATVPLQRSESGIDRRLVLAAIARAVPILRQPRLSESPELCSQIHPSLLSCGELAQRARREGRVELGTLGRGNHFLEVQADADDRLWLMVHSGSRAMGQAIYRVHTRHAQRGRGGIEFLAASTSAGQAYLNDAAWAVRFAQVNRRRMLEAAVAAVSKQLGAQAEWSRLIETDHNHVRLETHFGEPLLVHRKGAASAHAGEPGLIPGCMGGESFHVIGRGIEESLCSSSHGAGRAMSRGEARRQIRREEVLEHAGDARLADALREEAPRAYKNIRAVMRAQRELVKIQRVVRGMVIYKGV